MKAKQQSFETIQLTFADADRPIFKAIYGKDYIPFGKKTNEYSLYINSLYNRSAKHSAIINGKCYYIYGKGLVAETPSPEADQFIKNNEGLLKRIIFDIENHGGCYINLVPNRVGTGWFAHHVSFSKILTNKDNSRFFFSENWEEWSPNITSLPAYAPGIREACVFSYKEYRGASNDPYALPSWFASLNWIESDIQVSMHTLTNAKEGFNATKLINFYNGVPDNEGKRQVTKQFRAEHGGPAGETVIIAFNEVGAKAPEILDLGESALSKEDFNNVNSLISDNLYAGHSITTPELFGVPSSSKLSGGEGNKLKVGYEIFKNTYANGKQQAVEKLINFIAGLCGVTSKLTLKQVEPVGLDFTETTIAQVLDKNEIRALLGYEAIVEPTINEAQGVNSTLTNLTGRQRQNVMGIVRKFGNGQLTKPQASILLKKGYGFTDQDVSEFLGIDEDAATDDATQKFSAENDDDLAAVFASFGEDIQGFDFVGTQDDDAFLTFDDDFDISNYIEKHPKAKPEEIAKKLNLPLAQVKKILPPDVGTQTLPKFEVRYSYEKRPGVGGPPLIPTSRPFCVKMIGLNRYYSREDIQKISSVLGYDVFKRAGGFWGDDYKCRHTFKSNVVIRKK